MSQTFVVKVTARVLNLLKRPKDSFVTASFYLLKAMCTLMGVYVRLFSNVSAQSYHQA